MNIDELYIQFYDNLCKLTPYKNMLQEIYRELGLKHGDVILDAGCGTGHACSLFAIDKEVNIIGIDNSREALMLAQSKIGGRKNITLKEADINMPLQFSDNSFDVILLINVLFLLKKPEEVLKEMYRVLKPGGKIVIVNPVSNEDVFETYRKYWKKDNGDVAGNLKLLFQLISAKVISKIIEIKERKEQFNFIREEQFSRMLKQFNFGQIRMRMTNGEQALMVIAVK